MANRRDVIFESRLKVLTGHRITEQGRTSEEVQSHDWGIIIVEQAIARPLEKGVKSRISHCAKWHVL